MKQLLIILLCGSSLFLGAQSSVEVDITSGRIWKHSKKLLYDIPPASLSLGLHVQKQTDGSQQWHKYWGNPKLELISNYQYFGDANILGYAVSFAPGIIFRLKKWKTSSLHFHYASGISYLNKTHNRISNPLNNAIGSHVNNTTRLKISLTKKMNQEWSCRFGLGLVHFSNGKTNNPNSGINIYGVSVGFIRKSISEKVELKEATPFQHTRRWGINIQGGIGKSEYDLIGGPNFPVYAISVGGYYRYKNFQRVHYGMEYEYSVATAEFERATFHPELADEKARRTIIYIANELIFGDIRLRFQAGYYTKIYSSYEGKPVYFKVQSSYYPKFLKHGDLAPYIGIMLKTHYAVAEYVSLNFGVDI